MYIFFWVRQGWNFGMLKRKKTFLYLSRFFLADDSKCKRRKHTMNAKMTQRVYHEPQCGSINPITFCAHTQKNPCFAIAQLYFSLPQRFHVYQHALRFKFSCISLKASKNATATRRKPEKTVKKLTRSGIKKWETQLEPVFDADRSFYIS